MKRKAESHEKLQLCPDSLDTTSVARSCCDVRYHASTGVYDLIDILCASIGTVDDCRAAKNVVRDWKRRGEEDNFLSDVEVECEHEVAEVYWLSSVEHPLGKGTRQRMRVAVSASVAFDVLTRCEDYFKDARLCGMRRLMRDMVSQS